VGNIRYLLSDGLGSVRQALDETGVLVSYHEYDPYGNTDQSPGAPSYGFTGEWWQDEIALLYLRARWYAPGTGTFLSRDIWDGNVLHSQSLNGWNYVRGNVTNKIDPSGLCEENGDESCWSVYENIIFLCSECVAMERPVMNGYRTLHKEPIRYLQGVLSHVQSGWRPLFAESIDEAIRIEASRYGVPWQVVASVLESEIRFDTQWWDYVETDMYRAFPWTANLRPDPGLGVGNVHVTTAKTIARYFETFPLIAV